MTNLFASEPRGRFSGALAVLLLALTIAAYFPALRGEFLLDDDLHVTRPELRSVSGLARIWFEPGATQQYYPVLHTAFWLEHRLWGDTVLGYHLANVFLHAIAALLVVALVRELRLPGAWLAGFIFALHPVCVESVAWIAEQKNTLSTVFYLGAALAYLCWIENTGRMPVPRYAIASALFLLALLSKTATATLPAVLLVVAWWQRGNVSWKRDVLPLVPWFAAAALVSLVTVQIERDLIAGIGANLSLTWIERALIASRAVWSYFCHLMWPENLAFFYERFPVNATDAIAWLPAILVVASAITLVLLARRSRGPLAVFLIFAGTLLPVLGFVNVEWFVFAFVADHFQYVANLSLIVAAAAGLARLRMASAIAGVLVLALGLSTWRYSAVFHNSVTLYANAVARSPASAVAHNHYGAALAKIPARLPEAIEQFEAALRINPDAAEVHENLGELSLRVPDRSAEAIRHLDTAIRLKPQLARARQSLAGAHFDRGKALAIDLARVEEAIAEYERALRLEPNFFEAHYNLGNALMRIPGRETDAMEHFEQALRLKPDFPEAHTNLGTLLARRPGRLPDAMAHFEAALRADPNFAPARNNLERARRLLGASGR